MRPSSRSACGCASRRPRRAPRCASSPCSRKPRPVDRLATRFLVLVLRRARRCCWRCSPCAANASAPNMWRDRLAAAERRSAARHSHRAGEGLRRRPARESGGAGHARLSRLRIDRRRRTRRTISRRACCPRACSVVLAHGTDSRTRRRRFRTCWPRCAPRANAPRFWRSPIPTAASTNGWLRALVAPLAEPGVGALHRLSLVRPRPARFLVAAARRLGRGRGGHARPGRQSVRLGRRHGDSQGAVLRRARPGVLAGRPQRRLRAQRGRACRRAQTIAYAPGRAHPVPGTHHRRPRSSAGSAARWRSRACTRRASGGRA